MAIKINPYFPITSGKRKNIDVDISIDSPILRAMRQKTQKITEPTIRPPVKYIPEKIERPVSTRPARPIVSTTPTIERPTPSQFNFGANLPAQESSVNLPPLMPLNMFPMAGLIPFLSAIGRFIGTPFQPINYSSFVPVYRDFDYLIKTLIGGM
ncbi:MAG: hypothetical protein DRP74_08095 [Candidatus Omnitrophota bacterium]|nr:MAG: hypothetical protein DRP74_08095 [Candidatus Omnitrophota bacterium]